MSWLCLRSGLVCGEGQTEKKWALGLSVRVVRARDTASFSPGCQPRVPSCLKDDGGMDARALATVGEP